MQGGKNFKDNILYDSEVLKLSSKALQYSSHICKNLPEESGFLWRNSTL